MRRLLGVMVMIIVLTVVILTHLSTFNKLLDPFGFCF